MGDGRVVYTEVDFGVGEIERGGSGGDGAGGMKDELPLGVRVENADGGVGAEEGEEDDGAEGFEDPGYFDEGDQVGESVAALGIVTGGETRGGTGFAWSGLRHLADTLRISHLGGEHVEARLGWKGTEFIAAVDFFGVLRLRNSQRPRIATLRMTDFLKSTAGYFGADGRVSKSDDSVCWV